jgi:hypothetical protein
MFVPGGTGTLNFAGATSPVTWEIKDDVICFAATVNGQRESECDRVHAAGSTYEFMDSTTGALNNTYTAM